MFSIAGTQNYADGVLESLGIIELAMIVKTRMAMGRYVLKIHIFVDFNGVI